VISFSRCLPLLAIIALASAPALRAQTLLGTWTSSSPTSMGAVSLANAGTNSRGQTFYTSGSGANAFNSLTNDFSIVAWVTPSSNTGLQGIFSTNNNNAGGQGWYLSTNGSALRFTKLGILDINTNSGVFSTGSLQKFAVTVSPTAGVKFYVNDTLVFTSDHTVNAYTTTNGLAVGSIFSNNTADYGFAGSIQSVSVYSGMVAIPEPTTYAALFGALALLGAILRHSRSA
jgi:hypothetical protein